MAGPPHLGPDGHPEHPEADGEAARAPLSRYPAAGGPDGPGRRWAIGASQPEEGRGFRGDLEGLRAVAVGLVLLYHAAVPGFAGGYVGVDVFFVLSGFLITGLLAAELRRSGTVDLGAFYARRLRRLLPASLAVLVATAVASALILPPLRVPDVAGDVAAASLYASNLRFAFEATDYLAGGAPPSPVLHYWSLGVEEQFYLVWPALLLGAWMVLRRRIVVAVAATWVLSFALGVWLTDVNGPWAFFSLPTRAWQLATGGLLALALPRLGAIRPRLGAVIAWAGLGAIACAGLAFDDGTAFPGTAALLPTLGAALVIAGGTPDPAAAPGRFLASAVPRWVGRISYSLYLWHWPVLILPAVAAGGELPLAARVGLALLTFPVAHLSHRWIEEPIRRGRLVGTRVRANLRLAAVATLVVAVAAGGLGAAVSARLGPAGDEVAGGAEVAGGDLLPDDPLAGPTLVPVASPSAPAGSGAPSPGPTASAAPASPDAGPLPPTPAGPVPTDLRPSIGAARDDLPTIYADGCHLAFEAVEIPACVFGDPAAATTVVLWGDSHGAQWFPALDRLGRAAGFRLISLTKSGCGPVDVRVWNANVKREYTECATWRAAALARIAAEAPDLVVVAASDVYSFIGDAGRVSATVDRAGWLAGYERTLRRLVPLAGRVALISDTPRASVDPPVCLSAHLDDALACATDPAAAVATGRRAEDAALAAATGIGFVDPSRWVCPSDPCPAVVGRYLVYRDEHHLTATYATALSRRLGAALGLPAAP